MTARAVKYRLFFPDGDWFQDEDGKTEFGLRQAKAIEAAIGTVDFTFTPWPPPKDSAAPALCGHRQLIATATGVTDPAVIAGVEEIMRLERLTLDALDRRQFAKLARDAYAAYRYLQEG